MPQQVMELIATSTPFCTVHHISDMNEIVMKADKRAIYSITGASYFICCQIGWRFMPDSVDIVAFNFNKS